MARALGTAVPAEEIAARWQAGGRGRKRLTARKLLIRTGAVSGITREIAGALQQVWAEGWREGAAAAAALTGVPAGDTQVPLLLRLPRTMGPVTTRVKHLEELIAGHDPEGGPALAHAIHTALADPYPAGVLTQTEFTWAAAQAAVHVYQAAGVPAVRWVTAHDSAVCSPTCDGNHTAGQVPLGEAFPSGDSTPPGHPNCRCALYPAGA